MIITRCTQFKIYLYISTVCFLFYDDYHCYKKREVTSICSFAPLTFAAVIIYLLIFALLIFTNQIGLSLGTVHYRSFNLSRPSFRVSSEDVDRMYIGAGAFMKYRAAFNGKNRIKVLYPSELLFHHIFFIISFAVIFITLHHSGQF